uniref:SFRICE_007211 n=1 Tax=Spodoptera frugiperda TaxID=7108 RepID=A0A2H1V1Z7_SPOFR
MCSVEKLKELVQSARKGPSVVEKVESKSSKTKSIGTKCSDIDFQNACTCFSDTLIGSLDPALFKVPTRESSRVVADSNISTTYMTQPIESFALDRAFSLRNILDDVPDLQDVFKKMKCE